MRNIVFLNLIHTNTVLIKGKTVSRSVMEFVSRLPEVGQIIPIASDIEQIKSFFDNEIEKFILLNEDRQDLLLDEMSQAAEGFSHCFYLYGDTPLLDPDLFERMYKNHLKYFADYTFADGYPYGLSVEIVTPRTLDELKKIQAAADFPVKRDALFGWIQKDINSFDIETEISKVDLRMKRISLSADSKINIRQLNSFIDAGIVKAEDFVREHERLEAFCRSYPNYYQVQISTRCPQSCFSCPYPGMNPDHLKDSRHMPEKELTALIDKIEAYTPDAVVCLSLWGEPSLYPGISEVLKKLLERSSLSFLIETSGLGWSIEKDPVLQEVAASSRIQWIFSLDALSPEVYEKIRGKGYSEAYGTAESFLALNPRKVWVQAVRMKGFEEDLENFYRHWKEKTENVIIQKYDHFSLRLEEKKVTDLSPLRRSPCWHLKREMALLADGRALLCREDIGSEHILGNCFQEELSKIWDAGSAKFEEHLKGEYCGICEHCDEYYSYNF